MTAPTSDEAVRYAALQSVLHRGAPGAHVVILGGPDKAHTVSVSAMHVGDLGFGVIFSPDGGALVELANQEQGDDDTLRLKALESNAAHGTVVLGFVHPLDGVQTFTNHLMQALMSYAERVTGEPQHVEALIEEEGVKAHAERLAMKRATRTLIGALRDGNAVTMRRALTELRPLCGYTPDSLSDQAITVAAHNAAALAGEDTGGQS